MEEKKSDGKRKCVIKDKRYDFYYKSEANYVNNAREAIFNYKDVPDSVKKDSRLEILFLDSKEGLELLAEEEKPLQSI